MYTASVVYLGRTLMSIADVHVGIQRQYFKVGMSFSCQMNWILSCVLASCAYNTIFLLKVSKNYSNCRLSTRISIEEQTLIIQLH